MFNFLSFLMSLLHSVPFRHVVHFLACITLELKYTLIIIIIIVIVCAEFPDKVVLSTQNKTIVK